MEKTMQQIQLTGYGSADNLRLVEVPLPQPAAGEVLVRIAAAGINYSDVLRRRDTYFMPTPLPYVLGAEAVGEIVQANPASPERLPAGTQVLAILPQGGGYAEYVTADAQYCIPIPPHIPAAQATALFVQGSTAHLMVHQVMGQVEGKSVLVHAAAGGVGSLLVQLLKLAGATVIGASSSPAKTQKILDSGADAAIVVTGEQWPQQVIEANQGQKVDWVLEMVGGKVYEQSFACLATCGSMLVYGAASGQPGKVHSEHFVDESHNLLAFNLAHFIQFRMEDWQASLGAMIGLLAEGKIRVHTPNAYPLAEASSAHEALENKQTTGKVVLLP